MTVPDISVPDPTIKLHPINASLLCLLLLAGCGQAQQDSAAHSRSESTAESPFTAPQESPAGPTTFDDLPADEGIPAATFGDSGQTPPDDWKRSRAYERDSASEYSSSDQGFELRATAPETAATPETQDRSETEGAATDTSSPTAVSDLATAHTAMSGRSMAPTEVEVYFATDRLPTVALLPSPMRTFAPAGIIALLCCALVIGFTAARRFQTLWLLACGLAVCLGLTVLHSCIIRWQQHSRLVRNAETQFSSERYEAAGDFPLNVGTALVILPAIHQPGRMEAPSLLRLEFTENPDRHVMLQKLKLEESADQWFSQISSDLDQQPAASAFIFIHGYNVRFADAIKRTAQLATDLGIHTPVICYSWPSRGHIAGYPMDEAAVSWSAPHFERLIQDLHAKTGCTRINVIAHSMGNRALLEAIERLALRQSMQAQVDQVKWIDTLVMAAPDVDIRQFVSRYASALQSVVNRATLYYSEGDVALHLSTHLHGGPRLGFILDQIPQANFSLEPIHIGRQDLFDLGHSYYGSNPAVIGDLRSLLNDNLAANDRPWLVPYQSNSGKTYWELDHTRQAGRPSTLSTR